MRTAKPLKSTASIVCSGRKQYFISVEFCEKKNIKRKLSNHSCITGIILEYEQGGLLKTKSVDLLDLRPE